MSNGDKPKFDPNKPFTSVTTGDKPPFDPNKPFTSVKEPALESAYTKTAGDLYAGPKETPKVSGEVLEPWKEQEAGYGTELLNSLNAGAAALESGLLKAPGFVYDVFAAPFNYVLSGQLKEDLEGKKRGTYSKDYTPLSSDRFKDELTDAMGVMSPVGELVKAPQKIAENLDAIVTQNREQQAEKYGTSISDNFAKGEYTKGLKLLGTSVAEAVPTTAALMLGAPAGLTTTDLTALGGAVFGAQKKQELDEQFPDMPEQQKVLVSVLNGLSEGYIESSFGLTKLGAEIGAIFKGKGVEAGKEFAKRGFEEVYMPVFKKYAGKYAEEVSSEMVTQYVQNSIDKYVGGQEGKNLMDGVVDAGLVATGMAGPITGVSAVAEAGQIKRGKAAEQKYQKQKYQERSDAAFDAVNGGTESVAILKDQLTQANQQGDLSDKEYEKAIFQVDSYNTFNKQAADIGLTKEQKKEAFELSFNIDALKAEIPTGKEDIEALDPIAQAKINTKKELMKGLQKELNDLILNKEVEKEPKVAEETKAKAEPKEAEGLDELLKKYGKTEVGATEVDVEEVLKATKPAREKIEEIPVPDWNDNNKTSSLKRKQVVQEALKTTPNNELDVTLEEGENGKLAAILEGGRRLDFAQSAPKNQEDAVDFLKRENLPEGVKTADADGRPRMRYPEPVKVKRVEVDARDLETDEVEIDVDGKPKRKAVLSVYNPKTGKHIGFIRELDKRGFKYYSSKYSPTEKSDLNKITNSNHLTDEILPYTYRAKEQAAEPVVKQTEGAPTPSPEKLGKGVPTMEQQPGEGRPDGDGGSQPELTKREKELKSAAKPEISLDFIADKDALVKEVKTEVTAPDGEKMVVELKTGKVQADIKRRLELLKKVLDCIHG
jgi:hypothetical protein